MRTLRKKFDSSARRFLRDQRGSAAVMFAGGLVMLVGMAAIAVDLSHLFGLQGKLQTAADAAVLAAASELPDTDAARSAALSYATKNMPTGSHGTVLVPSDVATGNWDSDTRTFTADGAPLNAVRVVTRRSGDNGNAVGLFFARVLGFNEADIVTEAIASGLLIDPFCLLSLDPSAKDAVKINNGSAIVEGCSLRVNSNDSKALNISRNGTLEADAICVAGGYSGTASPTPVTGCSQVSDPLAGLEAPTYSGCDYTDASFSSGTYTLTPGVYCGGISVSSSADVTFAPGTYIIDGGSLKSSGNGSIMQGDGVTFYFGGDSRLKLGGQGEVQLSAPTSGGLKGILFFGDPNADQNLKHSVTGGSNITFDGTMYFPENELSFTGNGAGADSNGYSIAIARLLKFSGNGSLKFKYYDDDSAVPLPDGLVGMTDTSRPALVK